MIWSFVILGSLALIAAGLGVMTSQAHRTRLAAHALAMVLLAIAWIAGHQSGIGWVSLAAASIAEVIIWGYARIAKMPGPTVEPVQIEQPFESTIPNELEHPLIEDTPTDIAEPVPTPDLVSQSPPTTDEPQFPQVAQTVAVSVIEPEPLPPPAPPPPPPPPEPRVLPPYVTYALLRVTHDITGDVFTASLRRGGRRDASLVGKKADGAWQVQAGALFIELSKSPKMTPDALAFAAAQSFDWPEAIDFCRNHNALVRLATPMMESTSRPEILKLHHQAHAALSEFVPIVAIYWEGPGKLAPASSIKSRGGERGDKLDLYVSFRSFPEDDGQRTTCDTMGLHALGMPDLQIIAAGEPDESLSTALYKFAELSFRNGCEWTEAQGVQLPGNQTRFVRLSRALHAPDREVIDLVESLPDSGDMATEQFSHDAIGYEQPSTSELNSSFGNVEQP